jgi:hypothetical protein
MDDFTDTLHLLQSELPDPFQELFFQAIQTLDAFHLFLKLPIEMRLMIWRETFPRTRILWNFHGSDRKLRIQYPKAPVSFFINRESHLETLKNYRILRFSNQNSFVIEGNQSSGYVFWNYDRDIVRSNWCSLFLSKFYFMFKRNIFFDQGLIFLRGIQTLELTVDSWNACWFSPEPHLVDGHTGWLETLVTLSELRLISKTNRLTAPEDAFSEVKAQECIGLLTKYLKDLVAKDPARRVPRVLLYQR